MNQTIKAKLESLKNNEEEIKKCKENPLYFYNTYILKEGQRPMEQQEYDLLVKQVELYRNAIPLRMRRGNYVFMKPIKAVLYQLLFVLYLL
jgi:hypothetical protein